MFWETPKRGGGGEAVKALGSLGTDSAVEALKKIVSDSDEGHVKPKEGKDYFVVLRRDAIETLWNIRGVQENTFFCSFKGDPELPSIRDLGSCKDNSQ